MTTNRASIASGKAISQFRRMFNEDPALVVQAPGRVNLIGEHTDYNSGLVLPMAIDRWISIAARPLDEPRIRAHSDGHEPLDLDLSTPSEAALNSGGWGAYVGGAAWGLATQHVDYRPGLNLGWEGIVTSSIPTGASLSSSAALLLANDRLLAALANLSWDPVGAAHRANRVENHMVGVRTGTMDQLASACGQEGKAVFIDCLDDSIRYIDMPDDLRVVVLDTGTRRELTSSDYNQRRHECEDAAGRCHLSSLRQLDAMPPIERDRLIETLPLNLAARAQHVVSENERTRSMVEALTHADHDRMGLLLAQSHASLRDDYRVSSPALDAMVEAATTSPWCLGARMTGAGFGGCAMALVESSQVDAFMAQTSQRYSSATELTPHLFACRSANGAGLAS